MLDEHLPEMIHDEYFQQVEDRFEGARAGISTRLARHEKRLLGAELSGPEVAGIFRAAASRLRGVFGKERESALVGNKFADVCAVVADMRTGDDPVLAATCLHAWANRIAPPRLDS